MVPTEYEWKSDGIAGLTFLRNAQGEWHVTNLEGNPFLEPGEPAEFLSGEITLAVIYFNPNFPAYYQSALSEPVGDFRYHYLLRHEMGHAIGLGHPSDFVTSLMHRGIDTTQWNTLQPYDKQELFRFYNTPAEEGYE